MRNYLSVNNAKYLKSLPDSKASRSMRLKMMKLYQEHVDNWRRYGKEELGERFRLCKKEISRNESNPLCSFYYINKYGYAGIHVYIIDSDRNKIIITTDLYTQGYNGHKRRNGQKGYEELEYVIKNISSALGYIIYDITQPHENSIQILKKNGYAVFSDESRDGIEPDFGSIHKIRWDNMMESKYIQMIKEYLPGNSNEINLDTERRADLESVLVTMKATEKSLYF